MYLPTWKGKKESLSNKREIEKNSHNENKLDVSIKDTFPTIP